MKVDDIIDKSKNEDRTLGIAEKNKAEGVLEGTLLNDFAGEESVSMCEVLDKIEARGRIEGIIEGQEKVNALNKILIEAKRFVDLEKATKDLDYQNKLMKDLLPV